MILPGDNRTANGTWPFDTVSEQLHLPECSRCAHGRLAKLTTWHTLRRHRIALRKLEFTGRPMSVGELREASGRAAALIVR